MCVHIRKFSSGQECALHAGRGQSHNAVVSDTLDKLIVQLHRRDIALACHPSELGNGFLQCLFKRFPCALYKGHMGII